CARSATRAYPIVAAMPFTVWTARKMPLVASRDAGFRSHSRSSWLQALRCSRDSARNSSAYCERSMLPEDPLHRLEYAGRLERLDHEVLCARLNRLDHQRLLAHGAAHQHLRLGIVFHDLAHRVDAAHVRHHNVHRDQI